MLSVLKKNFLFFSLVLIVINAWTSDIPLSLEARALLNDYDDLPQPAYTAAFILAACSLKTLPLPSFPTDLRPIGYANKVIISLKEEYEITIEKSHWHTLYANCPLCKEEKIPYKASLLRHLKRCTRTHNKPDCFEEFNSKITSDEFAQQIAFLQNGKPKAKKKYRPRKTKKSEKSSSKNDKTKPFISQNLFQDDEVFDTFLQQHFTPEELSVCPSETKHTETTLDKNVFSNEELIELRKLLNTTEQEFFFEGAL